MASSPTPSPAASSGMSNNVAGLLCYIFGWITGLIFLLIEPYKNDKFVRFHAFQSIFFNVALIGVYILLAILGVILGFIHLGLLLIPLWLIVWVGILGTWIFLMVKAYGNQTFKLPIIGELAAKQAGL
ncbi:MAG TPA: DUF4870 domain-containing protein [Candidatus Angelobacter sp.]|nr:DUF4870 domain-containing protein [Candidatus Angelobacter sp.]